MSGDDFNLADNFRGFGARNDEGKGALRTIESRTMAGVPSRDVAVKRRRRQGTDEPVDQFNLRASVEDINAFVDFAERHRLSYREAFGLLMRFQDQAAELARS